MSGSLTQVLPRRDRVALPHKVGVLPTRAGCFQDRAAMSALREAVGCGGTAVVCQVLAGMGGVGKTQLAAEHARHAWDSGEVDLLVWVTAATRHAVIDAYTQAAADILAADPTDPERAAKAFLAWLEPKPSPQAPRWLIVLDNVTDPGDLTGLWPPTHACGRTLVTTRRRDAALALRGRLVTVGLFTPAEATTYLQEALAEHGRHEPAADLAALAGDLGHLPLALSQAAAYLIDAHLDAATYRTRLTDRARQLPDLLPEPKALPDDQPTTVAAAWSLSLDRADTLRPAGLARPMLQLAAMLDPNGMPEGVLTSAPALTHLTAHRSSASVDSPAQPPPAVTVEEATGALRALHRLSLIDHTPDTPHRAVRVHQLIQRATRDPLTPDQHDQTARTAADCLIAAWPETERDTGLVQILRANTTALTTYAEDGLYRPDAHPVLYVTGRSLGEAGQVVAARDHFQRLTEAVRRRLGDDHLNTLAARGNFASWRGEAGDAAGAADAFADLLEHTVSLLGEDHHSTLAIRNNLATTRGRAGDAAGAADAFADLLEHTARVRGEDHPDTLITRNNLASWRGQAGDAAGAADAFADLLEHTARVRGKDHPDTLTTRNNLAFWRGEAGDAPGAADALTELLSDRIRVLGKDHPDTLTTRNNLAGMQGRAGDAAGAADALTELLSDRLRVLGKDHPDTLTTRNNLAFWRGKAGDAPGAADALTDLLSDRIRVLGKDHPDTLTTRGNLADMRGKAGDAAGAADALTGLLAARVRVLGKDHPRTLTARNHLAYWRGKAAEER
ncbi:FxSxx-COOH system tetratricopeptide repeat protein [Streptomyces lavendulocolor]|uniref:FxSxx-COOH system tetratricopeptide repeat protein n=1 Tax=Streptomyces lavendulocolor TaxID=67316 RepID=UPI003C2B5A18